MKECNKLWLYNLPNNGLVTETAQQYFQGSQGFRGDAREYSWSIFYYKL